MKTLFPKRHKVVIITVNVGMMVKDPQKELLFSVFPFGYVFCIVFLPVSLKLN